MKSNSGGGLLLLRRSTPLPRRAVDYFCSGVLKGRSSLIAPRTDPYVRVYAYGSYHGSMAVTLLAAHRPFPGTCSSRSESGACGIERCSPRPVPFLPNLRRRFATLVRLVHRYYGTVRLLQHVHVRRSVYGLRGPALIVRPRRAGDLPVSRACCFSACAGSQTTQDLTIHSRIAWLSCCLPPLGKESASCSIGFSKLNSPAHLCLCLRFKRHLAISPARLEVRMDSLLPFL